MGRRAARARRGGVFSDGYLGEGENGELTRCGRAEQVSIMVFSRSLKAASLRLPATRSLATATSQIGATKVAMSIFEKDKFINYQRIEDNLVVVRQR